MAVIGGHSVGWSRVRLGRAGDDHILEGRGNVERGAEENFVL